MRPHATEREPAEGLASGIRWMSWHTLRDMTSRGPIPSTLRQPSHRAQDPPFVLPEADLELVAAPLAPPQQGDVLTTDRISKPLVQFREHRGISTLAAGVDGHTLVGVGHDDAIDVHTPLGAADRARPQLLIHGTKCGSECLAGRALEVRRPSSGRRRRRVGERSHWARSEMSSHPRVAVALLLIVVLTVGVGVAVAAWIALTRHPSTALPFVDHGGCQI